MRCPRAANNHWQLDTTPDLHSSEGLRKTVLSWTCAEMWVGWGEILGMGLRPR